MHDPVIILVRPQLGDNIGAVARVMGNFALKELRLVAPRDGWPNPRAEKSAVTSIDIVKKAKVFGTTAEAVADLHHIYATTVRDRNMTKNVDFPKDAADRMKSWLKAGTKAGVMFGPERTGLENEDVEMCDHVLTIPTNPEFASMNLSHAVAVVGYEWYGLKTAKKSKKIEENHALATKEQVLGMLKHMDEELDIAEHYKNPTMRPTMRRNLHNLFQRMDLTDQEVRTLRGVVRSLAESPKRKKAKKDV